MWFQIIVIALLLLICGTVLWNNKEHFWFIPQGISICDNVIGLGRHACKRCTNAGYCTLPNGASQCVPGDFHGPYNGQDCTTYEYGNDYANLSLIDPPQPYFVEPNRYWNYPEHIITEKTETRPITEVENQLMFRHGSPPQDHHRKL